MEKEIHIAELKVDERCWTEANLYKALNELFPGEYVKIQFTVNNIELLYIGDGQFKRL